MEKKKKETRIKKENKKVTESKKQSTIFFVIIAIFVLLILVGVIASKNIKPAFGTTSYEITFRGDSGYDLSSNAHYGQIAPPHGICNTDEYGYLNPECAYKIACVCRRWSGKKSGRWPNNCTSMNATELDKKCSCNDAEGVPCQQTVLYNTELFTKQFTNNSTYYCVYGSSYASGCDVQQPQTSCYVCEGGSSPVKTINETRAATMTGGTNCQKVADSQCEEQPSTPTNSCYACDLGVGKEYAYSTTPEGASTTTGGTNCQPVAKTKCDKRETSCYSCEGGTKQYQHATTVNEAKELTGGNKCTIVDESKCDDHKPKISCYSCNLGIGKEYEYATTKEGAAEKTGGKDCVAVADTYCDNRQENCYACDTKDGKRYYNVTSKENAEKVEGGTNCTIVKSSLCQEIPNNPKTGLTGIVIAWIVGLSALTYSFIYFIKLRKINN